MVVDFLKGNAACVGANAKVTTRYNDRGGAELKGGEAIFRPQLKLNADFQISNSQ